MAIPDKERFNVMFKPDLHPERNYRSEAVFEDLDIPVGPPTGETPIDDILQDLKDLEELAAGLPEGLEPVQEIVTKLRQRAEVLNIEEQLIVLINPPTLDEPIVPVTIPPDIPVPPVTIPPETVSPETVPPVIPVTIPPETPVNETIYGGRPLSPIETVPGTTTVTTIPGDTYSYTKDTIPSPGTIIIPERKPYVFVGSNVTDPAQLISGLPTSFVPATGITVSIETPKSLVEIAQDAYKKDQIDLQKFYIQKMRMALQRYFHHLLGLSAELSIANPDMLTKKYDGDYVTGISSNCQHLHDTIIRSQIQRLQKARIFRKMANADQTVTHMRSWNAAEKERERYYEEAYGNSETFVDSESNALLRQARSDYDAAYKLALYNMYKYLDASVKLTEDILDHNLTEAKAKAKLIKEGVDIFKTKEVKVTKDTNSVAKLQPKTKEQIEAEESAEPQNSNVEMTPEDVDKARGIEDPDENFDLAPSGGHYSKNDIDYLCSTNPELYNRDTPEGRAAIKAVLDLTDKYMAVKKEEATEQSSETDAENSGAEEQEITSSTDSENPIQTESKQKVDEVVPSPASETEPDIIVATQTGEGPSTIRKSELELESKPKQERTTISKQDQTTVTVDGITYTLTAKYVAYPYTKGNVASTTEGYAATATVKVIDNTGRILYIAQAKNGKPEKSASSVKKDYNNDPTTNQLIDKVYEMLTVKFWE